MTDTNTTSSSQQAVVQIRDVNGNVKNIQNITADVLQPDGSIQTIQRQVVELRDSLGNVIDLSGAGQQHIQLLQRLTQQLDVLIQHAQAISGQRFDARSIASLSDVA